MRDAFDLRGPSFTLDTACSSSLLALHQAAAAIRAGRLSFAFLEATFDAEFNRLIR